ncbi:MAG: hypothetical protein IID45_16150, partial [Planctomycetes bacterium]|nr:hypothetical protein [Planctomycetota bacterium]
DLKDERQNVIQALMEMDCIPAGMELFPAADGSDSMIAPAGEFLFHISAGVDLDVTTDITGAHYVHVLYKIVPA